MFLNPVSRFLYFNDVQSILFAMGQHVALTYVVGKMLKPEARLPLPLPVNKYFAYIKKTFLQYGIPSGLMPKFSKSLEAILNGESAGNSGGAIQQFTKIGLAISFIQGHINQLTLPLFYFYLRLKRVLVGKGFSDFKNDGFHVTSGDGKTEKTADEGIVTQLSLVYQCLQSFAVMFFGAIALMHSNNLTQLITQFFVAVMLTDVSQLKDFTKQRGLKWVTKFLETIHPVQRTLHLRGEKHIETHNKYSTYAEYTFFGVASLFTSKPSVHA